MAAMKTKMHNTGVVPKVEPEDTIIYEPGYNETIPVEPKHASVEQPELSDSFAREGFLSQGLNEADACVRLASEYNGHYSVADTRRLSTSYLGRPHNTEKGTQEEKELINMKYTKILQNLEEEMQMKRIEHRMKMKILERQLKLLKENKLY